MTLQEAGEAGEVGLQLGRAGLVSRLLASVADLAILVVAGLAVLLLSAVLRYFVAGPPFVLPSASVAFESTAAFVVATAYLAYFWTATGRTPGNQLLGLRVVDARERRLGAGRATLRAVLCLLLPVGLLWAAVSRRNASLQDLVLRTTVVYDWVSRP